MKTKAQRFQGVLLIHLFLSYLVIFVFSVERVRLMTKEGHFYENLGTLSLLSAAIMFFVLFLKDESDDGFHILQTRRNVFFLLLALLLFFGFVEEISWGQWVFHWQTPDAWRQINVQRETNIHNLFVFTNNEEGTWKAFWAEMLDMNRMFSVFWFIYFFAFPILNKTIPSFSAWVKHLNIPLVPVWLAVLYPLNFLIYKIIDFYFSNSIWVHQAEIRESYYEILIAAAGLWFLTEFQKNSKKTV